MRSKGLYGDFLSLFMRSMSSSSSDNWDVFVEPSDGQNTQQLLIQILLRIVSCCYRTVGADGAVTGKMNR